MISSEHSLTQEKLHSTPSIPRSGIEVRGMITN